MDPPDGPRPFARRKQCANKEQPLTLFGRSWNSIQKVEGDPVQTHRLFGGFESHLAFGHKNGEIYVYTNPHTVEGIHEATLGTPGPPRKDPGKPSKTNGINPRRSPPFAGFQSEGPYIQTDTGGGGPPGGLPGVITTSPSAVHCNVA